MKIFLFDNMNWSSGRVLKDVAKSLPEHEFTIGHWYDFDPTEISKKIDQCDVCIAGVGANYLFNTYMNSVDRTKCLFVLHGLDHDINTDPGIAGFTYGMTCNSIQHYFPLTTKVFLTPNGVHANKFDYIERSGNLNKIGWCGAPGVLSKRVSMAIEISKSANIEFSICSGTPCETDITKWSCLNEDEVRKWYQTVDMLLVTGGPDKSAETGPLPAFEAIVSGIPVIGTPVGNFANIPGPKFTTVEQGVEIVNQLKSDHERMKLLAKEQYEYVMNNYTYASVADKWREAIDYVYLNKNSR